MKLHTKAIATGAISMLALAACDPNIAGDRTRNGALIGAGVGAVAGATRESGNDRFRGAVGAGIGYSLDKQAAELDAGFSNGQIDVINTGSELIVRMPEGILFPVDSATLNGQLQSDLYVLANSLNKYPNSIVTVTGHTDNTGSAAYNQDLSERRASAVASVLRAGGVASSRIRVVGAGENQPIASNQTASGRQANRRVEVTITPTN